MGLLTMEVQLPLQIVWIVVIEPIHNRAARPRQLGCLLHGIVSGAIQEDDAVAAREDGQDTAVQEGDGRKDQDVWGPDKPCEFPFEIVVQARGRHGPRPARMDAPVSHSLRY
jgi:hypothetical protein